MPPDHRLVRALATTDVAAAVPVIARAMCDNPLHAAAFGTDPDLRQVRLARMFEVALPTILRKGVVLGAFADAILIGIAGLVPPGRCRPSFKDKLALLPRIVPAIGRKDLARVVEWTRTWARYDLREPHWHLGPIAVDIERQRSGVGSLLMRECCARIDREHAVAYLETDRPASVAFYQRFGFETIRSLPVLDAPNWFMRRPAH